MNYKSLSNITLPPGETLYDLTSVSFIYPADLTLHEYIVPRDLEMRIDLIFCDIYDIEYTDYINYQEEVDCLLYLNDIDNPLMVFEGDILEFPDLGALVNIRNPELSDEESKDILEKLATVNSVNKASKPDKDRENYVNNNYSLSPVLKPISDSSVRIQNNKFVIGGV